jgi:hypothetical protein
MSYYHKYLKYKNKYLSLKNMSGGGYPELKVRLELKKRLQIINQKMGEIDEKRVELNRIQNEGNYIKSDYQLEEQLSSLSTRRQDLQADRNEIEDKIKKLPMEISVNDEEKSSVSPYFSLRLEEPFDELPEGTSWIVETINQTDHIHYNMILKIKKHGKDPVYSINIFYNNNNGNITITPIVDMEPRESLESINRWLPAFTNALREFIHPAMTPVIQRVFSKNYKQ